MGQTFIMGILNHIFSLLCIWIHRSSSGDIWLMPQALCQECFFFFFQMSSISEKREKQPCPKVSLYKANVEFSQLLAAVYPEESFQWNINLWESHTRGRLHSNSSSMCKMYLVLARNGFNYVKPSEWEQSVEDVGLHHQSSGCSQLSPQFRCISAAPKP